MLPILPDDLSGRLRERITITGVVQGVGFRPFVYRMATEAGLSGWVNNSAQGVVIEVEGPANLIDPFIRRLRDEKPPRALIQSMESVAIPLTGDDAFKIQHTNSTGNKTTLILPDVATCPDCLRECLNPNDRRYLYPFTNCTNCGPRFSIIESLPYDRPNTTMKHFNMCDDCRSEYENPLDRRFHAQPNACPVCGPQLALWDHAGASMETHYNALLVAAAALRAGKIVALKGLGGFQLLVDGRNDAATERLRKRKQRDEKPFALMYPSLEMARAHCHLSDLEVGLLDSPEAPIVLLEKKAGQNPIAPGVAPGNPYLGIMLPYTPLHHMLMTELGFPIVATSGNLSGEPICIDEVEALERLGDIADLFLVHNRPIVRHVDDSIVREMAGRAMMVRRARGYAPLPLHLDQPMPVVLAVGAHLKSTVAVSVGKNLFTSQHIGDLETAAAMNAFKDTIKTFESLYEFQPVMVACDLHPDYLSTQYADTLGSEPVRVQHHYAHVLACIADNHIASPVLGVSWDGTGYGLDGTVWGGEFLLVDEAGFSRVAHLRQFRLPGEDQAIKEPRRSALGLLYALFGDTLFDSNRQDKLAAFSDQERRVLQRMLERGLNAPLTSSAGRLFDAVASLLQLRQVTSYEGQAAMELEWVLHRPPVDVFSMVDGSDMIDIGQVYGFEFNDESGQPLVVDWGDMVQGILADMDRMVPVGEISARFHNTLVEIIVAVARRVGVKQVALTGGCFQNRYLTERAIDRLRAEGFEPLWHRDIPPNDGGIAPGQILAALRHLAQGSTIDD